MYSPHCGRVPESALRGSQESDETQGVSATAGYAAHMIVRRIVLFAGTVALIVGIVGLFAPVSVSPEQRTVGCGSVIAPDLSAARPLDDGNAANVPVPGGGVAVDTNFTRLCEMNLDDRRIWASTLAAVGAVAIVAALVIGAMSTRATT